MLRLLHYSLEGTSAKLFPSFHSLGHFVEHLTRNNFTTASIAEPRALSFLQTFCGLSDDKAIAITKKIKLKSIEKSQMIVALLKEFGFSDVDVTNMIISYPKILNSKIEKNLKPKMEFYKTMGIGPRAIILGGMLLPSLEKRLRPNFEFLKSIVHDDAEIVTKREPFILLGDLRKSLPPRIQVLQAHNVTMPVIIKLIVSHPRVFNRNFGVFERAFNSVKDLPINPSSSTFANALGVIAKLSKESWERKMNNFIQLGWSEDQVMHAFNKYPFIMGYAERNIQKTSQFFVEKLDWGPELLCVYPPLLGHSLEKRLIPRYTTWQILLSKGLWLKDKWTITPRYFRIPKKKFLNQYVIRHKDKLPELADFIKATSTDKNPQLL